MKNPLHVWSYHICWVADTLTGTTKNTITKTPHLMGALRGAVSEFRVLKVRNLC